MINYRQFAVALVCILAGFITAAQDIVTLTAENFSKRGQSSLSSMEGWLFSPLNDPGWRHPGFDPHDWEKKRPFELSYNMANNKGVVQGWFIFRFKADSSLYGEQVYIGLMTSGATALYMDGRLLLESGHPELNPGNFRGAKDYFTEFETGQFPQPLKLGPGVFTIAVYFTDHNRYYLNRYSFRKMKPFFNVVLNKAALHGRQLRMIAEYNFFQGVWLSGVLLLSLLFSVLLLLNRQEKQLKWIALLTFALAFSALSEYFLGRHTGGIWQLDIGNLVYYESVAIALGLVPITLSQIINQRTSKGLRTFSIVLVSLYPVYWYVQGLPNMDLVLMVTMGTVLLTTVLVCIKMIIQNRKQFRKAEWSVVWGLVLFVTWMLTHTIFINAGFSSNAYRLATVAMIYLTLPVTFLIYISIRFSENIKTLRNNLVQISALNEEKLKAQEEKQKLVAAQNEMLERKVAERTRELEESLDHLKATQSQLIQSEKMASLGELTAGIAHEIQNPLNFVNNFSEVNSEMIEEVNQEIDKGNLGEAKAILQDLKENQEKINHHGKRADAIVKGMLQHSRASSGQKEPTDINALCDEYLRLAYHGLRAKDKTFNAAFKMDFDSGIGAINIVPQDIGRTILNLVNNAFYAVNEKAKQHIAGYDPMVTVSTKKLNGKVEISVKDNGNGIPDSIKEKIFQPFFTSKPTGSGTGLGLSLSYDIVKAHGGEIRVDSKEGEETVFVIQLPIA